MNTLNPLTDTPHPSPGIADPCAPLFDLLPAPAPPGPDPTAAQATPALPPPPRRRYSRNGKIARLPKLERDMVSRMLRNNMPYANIVAALDEFEIHVTERNVSNWKTRGGYREWCHEQDQALQVHLFQDNLIDYLRTHDASQVPEVGLQLLATCFSEYLLNPQSRQQIAADPDKYSRLITTLCRLTHQLHTLQKYRDDSARTLGYKDNPAYVRRADHKNVEDIRKSYSSEIGNGPDDPIKPHRNYLPIDR